MACMGVLGRFCMGSLLPRLRGICSLLCVYVCSCLSAGMCLGMYRFAG